MHMKDFNKLDIAGISNLGIGFETEEEMKNFAMIIEEELELRVGDEMTKTMTPKQINEFESIMGSGQYETINWLNSNCPKHREICQRVKTDIKKELLKYKNEIPGISQTPLIIWNGQSIEECGELSMRNFKLLKKSGVETLGELYALDKEILCEMLEISGFNTVEYEQIQLMLEKSRRRAGLIR